VIYFCITRDRHCSRVIHFTQSDLLETSVHWSRNNRQKEEGELGLVSNNELDINISDSTIAPLHHHYSGIREMKKETPESMHHSGHIF